MLSPIAAFELIYDFFALYLSQYRLNKLFLHNLLLWFSFYVQISYSNSSSSFSSSIFPFFLPTFISFKAYTYDTIVFSLVILSLVFILSHYVLFHATFPSSLLPNFTISTTSFFECYFSYLVKDILCQK